MFTSDIRNVGQMLFFFKSALKRVFVLPRTIQNLRDLGFCNFVRIDAAKPHAFTMNVHHDFGSRFDLHFHQRQVVLGGQRGNGWFLDLVE